MTEPSKEAWERARKLSWPQLAGQDITWLATALQKLMDERDEAEEKASDFSIDNVELAKRAEAAESVLGPVQRELLETEQRAEAAEKNAANYREQWDNEKQARSLLEAECVEAQDRAEAAEAKLAEMVRAVHAYASLLKDGWSLHEVAKRYAVKPFPPPPITAAQAASIAKGMEDVQAGRARVLSPAELVSEEALEMARGTWRIGKQENVRAIAEALQKLMDELDDKRQEIANETTDCARAEIRAEKAEAELARLRRP